MAPIRASEFASKGVDGSAVVTDNTVGGIDQVGIGSMPRRDSAKTPLNPIESPRHGYRDLFLGEDREENCTERVRGCLDVAGR